MFRTIGGIVVGYVAMVVFIAFSFTVALFVLGVDRTFRPATYDVTTLWLVVSLALSVVSALLGGKVCRMISQRPSAVRLLAALVLILGLASAILGMRTSTDVPPLRPPDVSTVQAGMYAKEPRWFLFLLPVIGVIGVTIGGRRKT